MKVFYLHWHEAELKERMAPLRKAGFRVWGHFSTESPPDLKNDLPDVAVLSLDRLPSHRRAIAEWLWEAKKRQRIPIVFVGGAPD